MRFVSGPFHNCEVPAEIVAQSEVILPGNTHLIRLTCLEDGSSTLYSKRWWWDGPGRPLRPYFAPVAEDPEAVIERARGVMC